MCYVLFGDGSQVEALYRESAQEAFVSDSYTALLMNGPGVRAARGLEAVLRRCFGPKLAAMPLSGTAVHLGYVTSSLVTVICNRQSCNRRM